MKGTIPFLKRQTVMFIGPLLVSSSGNLRTRISNAGFKFLYLPDVFSLISSDVLSYSFPGAATFSPDFVYEQIRAGFPQMGEMPGFIVNSYGELVFYPLPAKGEFAEFIDGFISAITPEESEIRFSKGSVSEEPVLNMEKTVIRKAKRPSLLGSIFRKKIKDEDAFRNVVTDRIAKFYYVDGKSGEKRKIALNREYVILDE